MNVMLLLHGGTGWDELLIAAIAFGVLWVAVRLAGRKPSADEGDADAKGEQAEGADPPVAPPTSG